MAFFAVLLLIACLPAYAHEGTAAEHLILGLDAGLVAGVCIGFAAGVVATTLFHRRSKRS